MVHSETGFDWQGLVGSQSPPTLLPTPGLTQSREAGRTEGQPVSPPRGQGQRRLLSSLPAGLQVVRKGRALLAQKS